MKLTSPDYTCGAELSSDGIYRYTLTRGGGAGPCVGWLMFNPSTADATEDDHTIRKCIGFSKLWGYGRMIVINLYAVRSRDPKAVPRMGPSAIGPMNDYWISQAVKEAREMICAWGCAQHEPKINARIAEVAKFIRDITWDEYPINCLGFRKDGHPKHPLMLGYETPRVKFEWRKS